MKTMMDDIATLASRRVIMQNGDFVQDGLVHCGKCKAKKQTRVRLFGEETERTVVCMCKCESDALQKQCEQGAEKAQLERISRLRAQGLHDRNYQKWTFAIAEKSPEIDKAKRYCAKWGEMFRQNTGLLLWGNVGRGKSFVAACIANELIAQGVPVLMTNFIKLSAAMQNNFKQDANEYIASLNNYSLLIIDDLGAERATPTAQEQVFNIIDSRYRAGKPLIITTNLTLEQMQNPTDMNAARIYDRVLEMTVPIAFRGENRRRRTATSKKQQAAKELEG